MKTVSLNKPFVIAAAFLPRIDEAVESVRSPDGLTFELFYGGKWHPETREANVYHEDDEGNTLFELWAG